MAPGEGRITPVVEFLFVAVLALLFTLALLVVARQQLLDADAVVTVKISSDPDGAAVFVDTILRGKTPLELELERGTTVDLQLIADEPYLTYDLYKPFKKRFTFSSNRNLDVWIPRTSAEEQEAQRRARELGP